MYLKTWDEFMSQALDLLMESPKARAAIKYNAKKQFAYLKVTDDKKWVQYKTKLMDQLEQFMKLTSKLILNVDPIEDQQQMEQEDTNQNNKKLKKKKGKGKK